jgi:hypothetical protein
MGQPRREYFQKCNARGKMPILFTIGLKPDFAVERKATSKEQTFRSEDNAFLPLRRRQLSIRWVTT